MAVTEVLALSWQTTPRRGPEHGLDFPEMAMKNNLILATAILLATLWFTLDAGITALTLLS